MDLLWSGFFNFIQKDYYTFTNQKVHEGVWQYIEIDKIELRIQSSVAY